MSYKKTLHENIELHLGIIPRSVWFLDEYSESVNPNRWNGISEEEKRVLKRRFRKILRKAKKKFSINKKLDNKASHMLVEKFIMSTLDQQISKLN